jgi:AcrR family transcriptional regulator
MPRSPAKVEPGLIRDKIIEVALTLFTERGYFNTSVPDIARAAQVSVGSIYHHFQDKQDVARTLYVELLEGLQGELGLIAKRYTSAHDRCRAVVAMLFDLTETSPAAMEFMLYAKHREFLPDELPVCSSRPLATMRSFVSEGMKNGEILSMDSMIAASSLFGGAIRLITARLDGVLDTPLPGLLEDVWACGWRGVAA